MTSTRKFMTALFVSLAVTITSPAMACYTGPMPLTFINQTANLTKASKSHLAEYAEMRGTNGQDIVLVTFYGGTPTRADHKTLREVRKQSISSYLRSENVPARVTSFATTQRRIRSDLAGLDEGFCPVATVELTIGCEH